MTPKNFEINCLLSKENQFNDKRGHFTQIFSRLNITQDSFGNFVWIRCINLKPDFTWCIDFLNH